MIAIALLLLGFTTLLVLVVSASGRWGMGHHRMPRRSGPTYDAWLAQMEELRRGMPWRDSAAAIQDAVLGSTRQLLERSDFLVFSNWIVFGVFLSFLMPLWSLSFATEALGGEREEGTLLWLAVRPLSRPAIYLGKFAALLPWVVGFNAAGFAVLCLAAGKAGEPALRAFWPAVLIGSFAFAALFHLVAVLTRRPAVVGLVYSFFLETLVGNMPGQMKRASISFYVRCIMFEGAERLGVQPTSPTAYAPVDAATAYVVLLGATAVLLAGGAWVFSRSELRDVF
jgi:hypothetical protein